MTKAELATSVAARAHLTRRQAEIIDDIFITSISQALKDGDKVELRGFGSFRTRSRGARQGRNPRTGDTVPVPSKQVPFFRAGKEFRDKGWQQLPLRYVLVDFYWRHRKVCVESATGAVAVAVAVGDRG